MTLSDQGARDRCQACGVSKPQVLGKHEELRVALEAMTGARDVCKRQTADVEELRQWQVDNAQVALQAIEAHGRSGIWTAEDCATQAAAALERMRSPVGSVHPGMQDPDDSDASDERQQS